jgi:hypothetical protein
MADLFARIRVLGREVACYLRPGTECDIAALTRDLDEACPSCRSFDELRASVTSVAERHALDVEYHMSTPGPDDPVERVVSFGFFTRTY